MGRTFSLPHQSEAVAKQMTPSPIRMDGTVCDGSGTRPPPPPPPRAQQLPAKRPTPGWRINSAIFNISGRLTQLAGLGRPGQWVIHNEDLYKPSIDTRPHSRKPDEEIAIRGLTYNGFPINDRRIIWAGKGPPPNFQDVAYWEGKAEELEAKQKQIEDGLLVDHQFTPKELATLESMERQKGHFFRNSRVLNRDELQIRKNLVRNLLTTIAELGRPGQWILHHEELYHPNIDTRPQSRKSYKGVPIRGFTTLNMVPTNEEYFWAGKGPPPDFEDHLYWMRKQKELSAKRDQIKNGQVHPQFTQEELSALESMERDEAHFFCMSERLKREKAHVRPLTPPSQEAAEKLKLARSLVWCELTNLWELGLPGKWVLHHEDIYLSKYDTRRRDDDETVPIPPIAANEGFEKTGFGLRYDGDWPLPDFNDLAYWEAKLQKLKTKTQEVEGGIVEHKFTPEDLMRLALLECDQNFREGASGRERMGGVDAWLSRENDLQAQPSGTRSPQNSQSMTATRADVSGSGSQMTRLPSPSGSTVSIHSRGGSSADSTGDSSSVDSRPRFLRVRDRILNRARKFYAFGPNGRQAVKKCGFQFQGTQNVDLENITFNSFKMDGRDAWYTAQDVEPCYDSAAFWDAKGKELDKTWRSINDGFRVMEGSGSKDSRPRHPELAVLGMPPPYSDEVSLPAQTMRPTKRNKVLQQPEPPLATKDGGIPSQNQTLERKPPTRSSSGRARAQPTKRKSTDTTNEVACPVAGQGWHPAKRCRKSQRPKAPARLRDATVPEPNYQPKPRRSARIAALPSKNYK
ncbi:hypothetical protein B0H63DRAFT_89486 [Podospora didyma]|uniref:Uncharacterized protein n=1 Tax=Podospora didyma TaxID=330526 RepID=A0AAE0N1V7_9PEZI|nr:hypothetical protein B0H63DRAFT_89486 [Podospora didyma]